MSWLKISWLITLAGAILIVLASLWVWLWWQSADDSDYVLPVVQVKINDLVIKAELVETAEDQYLGLSGRESLCEHCGMLFNFSDSRPRSFVMRNMYFPLDIIFINQGKIINIVADAPPEGAEPEVFYFSDGPADQVLELAGGSAAMYNLASGLAVEVIYEDKDED